jgi:hypothetical protein
MFLTYGDTTKMIRFKEALEMFYLSTSGTNFGLNRLQIPAPLIKGYYETQINKQ